MLRAVERGLEKRDKNRIYKHVCMDEKSIRRGHEYVSMLYDGETGQVIEVESGRKSESVDNLCTRALTEEQRNAVETVCIYSIHNQKFEFSATKIRRLWMMNYTGLAECLLPAFLRCRETVQ